MLRGMLTDEGYLPLNNLDELDARGTPSPEMEFDRLFYEPPEDKGELSYEERYAGLAPEDLEAISFANFFEGVGNYMKVTSGSVEHRLLKRLGLLDAESLVMDAMPYAVSQIRKHNATPSNNLTILDRFQNAGFELTRVAQGQYDFERGAPLAAVVQASLRGRVRDFEESGVAVTSDKPMYQGDLIRTAVSNPTYYGVRTMHQRLAILFGRELEPEELTQFGTFSEDEYDMYIQNLPTYVSWEELVESDPAFVDRFVDGSVQMDSIGIAEPTAEEELERALGVLSADQRLFIERRYGVRSELGKATLQELANETGVTREAIRQRQLKVIGLLQAASRPVQIPIQAISERAPRREEAALRAETPITTDIRELLRCRDGALARLREYGFTQKAVLARSGIEPRYANQKLVGNVFMDEGEALDLLEAAEDAAHFLGPDYSLDFILPPAKRAMLKKIQATLDERQIQTEGNSGR